MATILIVDDRPTNRELLVTLLGYAGYQTLEAANGEEGLSVARAKHPDLIITDIVMPKMDGYEFARQVRADAFIGLTQIIFYTSSYIVAETRRLAEACGVSLVIGKPIEPEIFLETIKTTLDHNQALAVQPVPEEFHSEHMRLLTDTLVKKVEDLEAEVLERKRAEAQLAEAHEFLEKILTYSPVGILTYKFTGECLSANEYAAQIVGTTIDKLLSQNFRELDSWKRSGLYELAERAIATRRQQKEDIDILTTFGKAVWFTAQFVVFQSGFEDCLLLTMTDITQYKQAEQALQKEKDRAQQYLDIAGVMFLVLSADRKVILINKKGCEILGYTEDEIIGRNWFDHFLPQEQKDMVNALFDQLMAGEMALVEYVENSVLTKSGQARLIAWHNSNLTDETGRIIGVVSSGEDITERKQAEEKIRRQLARLTALSEIDRAISSNLDMRLSLETVLVHVITQLDVDAADVLLFNSAAQTLEYAAGQGFHTQAIENAPISLSKGHAAHAVLNRRLLHIPDLRKQPDDSPRSAFFESEGFVSYWAVPLFAKGELNGMLGVFHRSPLQHDEEWLDFLNTLAGQCAIAIDNASLFSGLQRSNAELTQAYEATIEGWSHALDLRDKETEGHTRRVTEMALKLARAFKLSEKELTQVRRGALLHDIGKMGVPDGILLKPGPLTDEEWAIMKKHPTFAYELLSPIDYLHDALDIPYCHHEKWDGTGYPRGLKGEAIPLEARLFAVIDVWDALSSDRPYRAAWPKEKICEHIQSLAGTHFDPQVVKVFLGSDITGTGRKRK